MGEERLAALIQESLSVATKTGAAKPSDFSKVIVDATVQPKAVAHPTDAKLMHRAREKLVALARKQGVALRQSYQRVGKYALIAYQRYAQPTNFCATTEPGERWRSPCDVVDLSGFEFQCFFRFPRPFSARKPSNRCARGKPGDVGHVRVRHRAEFRSAPRDECFGRVRVHATLQQCEPFLTADRQYGLATTWATPLILVWQALKRMTRWRGREMRVGIVAKLLEPVIRERAVFLIASDLKKFRRMVVGKAQNVIPVLFVGLAPLPTRAVTGWRRPIDNQAPQVRPDFIIFRIVNA
jgi:hypothetical protein